MPPASHAPCPGAAPPSATRRYQPRRAEASPLYRVTQDHLETLAADRGLGAPRLTGPAESSLRAFLECGIPRFGVVRFLCRRCGRDRFVAFSCRRRIACLSCDAKRASVESAMAMEGLLPRVPYRQWVLVIPKRLRFFVNRDSAMAGELSRLLAEELARFYAQRTGSSGAPTQWTAIQRFGSRVNLHVHLHSVVSDGAFETNAKGRLRFIPAQPPSQGDIDRLTDAVRQRWITRLQRRGAIPDETASELLSREHSGFSLNGGVRVEARDRAALERLLRYCLRPALSLQRLEYDEQQQKVRYRPAKGKPGEPELLTWAPGEFLERFARIIPPPRRHLVRHSGALGPRSRLRPLVTRAAREAVPTEALLRGWRPEPLLPAIVGRALSIAGRAARAAARSWAAALRRVFEVDPLRCEGCGGRMEPVAAILADRELERLLAHLGVPTAFPVTKPARSPPLPFAPAERQLDVAVGRWHDQGEPHPED